MRSTSRNIICEKQPFGGGRRAVFLCAGMGSFAPPGASSFLSSLKESYQRKPLETTFQDFLGAGTAGANLAVLASRNWSGGGRCRFGGSLVPLAPLPLTAVRVGVGALIVFGDYQIAPIAARSTAMGRWRLTPPGVWGRRLRAGRGTRDTSSVSFAATCLPAGRSVRGSDRPPACHSTPRTPQEEG